VKELQESLDVKTKEAVKVEEDKRQLVEEQDLVKELQESLDVKTKEAVKVEEDKKQLEEERKKLGEEKNTVERVKIKVQEDRANVEEEKTKVKEETAKVEENRASVKKEMAKVAHDQLEVEQAKLKVEEDRAKLEEEKTEIEKMAKEQQGLVQCPVCLALPKEERPVPCCPQGHFVCSPCMDKLIIRQGKPDCPTCRVPMGQGQSLLALTVIKAAQHECRLQGCDVMLKFNQIKEHEEKCAWRLVLCPGSGSKCSAMIPFCTVLNHVEKCSGCKRPAQLQHWDWDSGTGRVRALLSERISARSNTTCPTEILKLMGEFFFFVRPARRAGIFTVDVVMKGSEEECKDFMVEASILNVESRESVFKAIFQPRPLTGQNEAIFCLSVPERGISKAWKYEESEKVYRVDFLVKNMKVV